MTQTKHLTTKKKEENLIRHLITKDFNGRPKGVFYSKFANVRRTKDFKRANDIEEDLAPAPKRRKTNKADWSSTQLCNPPEEVIFT